MKFIIPPIVRSVELSEYHPDFEKGPDGAPVRVLVWVNPTAELLREYDNLAARRNKCSEDIAKTNDQDKIIDLAREYAAIGEGVSEWYAKLWSRDNDTATHWTGADVMEMSAADPALYDWLTQRTWALIAEHRTAQKKV